LYVLFVVFKRFSAYRIKLFGFQDATMSINICMSICTYTDHSSSR